MRREIRKVLVIKLSALGDFVLALAAMKHIREAHPKAQITLLTTPPFEALARACHAIAAGAENVQVVGGAEHMHHLPMDSAIDWHPRALARSSRGVLSMGLTAEHLAATHGIERRRQEEYALESHARAARADDTGLFDDEIVPVLGHDEAGAVVEALADQSIRRDSSPEALAAASK